MSIEKVSIGSANGYIFQEESTKVFFDPPSLILDTHAKIQKIDSRMKYIEIEVQKSYHEDLSAIFLSNSHSLSVFFVKSEVPIYVTDIVYFQMKEKLKHYVNLGPVRRREKDSTEAKADTEIFEIYQYRKIAHRVHMLSFAQVVPFTYMSVSSHPGGTCLGWPVFMIQRKSTSVLAYTFGVPGACSLSLEMSKYTESMPLLVNYLHKSSPLGLKEFSDTLQTLSSKDGHIFVTMDIVNHSIEIALHLLSLFKDRTIYVYHKGFKRLVQFCEIKRKFLSQKFSGDSNVLLSTTARLRYKPLKYLLNLEPSDKSLIFCERIDYNLFFSSFPSVNLNDYSIKFFGGIESTLAMKWAHTIYLPEEYSHLQIQDPRIQIIGKSKIHLAGTPMYTIELANIEHVQIVSRIAEHINLYFQGTLREKGTDLVIECKESLLHKLAHLPDVSQIFINNALIYHTNNEVYKIEEKNHIIAITKLK
ncbi:hypothetical protein NECID01_1922 [Nematocida sp. AWRm77]|nr:hypothetical protein NECID01_1922 [Nematocida sp. AWRm77]